MRHNTFSRIILLAAGILQGINAYTYTDTSNIISNLTSGYDTLVRPDGMTNISLSFGLLSIGEVNTVTQEFALMGFFIAEWNDPRLTWTPSDYGNTYNAMMRTIDIWAPPMLVNNAADAIRIINDDSDLQSIFSYVFYTGLVRWLQPVNVVASCDINIAKYPFDSQTCNIIMSSWMFSDQQIYIYNTDNVINLDLYSENGEWDITSTSAAELKRTLHGFPMSAVSFTVEVERKYNYYVLNMILPVIILAFLGPFVFLLQIESGEQNGYSLTVLLSMSVVMTTVSDNIPPTANNVCILSVYLLTTYVLCALETLIVVIMTRMHNYTEKGYEPGWRTQRVVNVIAKATCYRRSGEERTSIKIGSKVGIVEIEDEKKTWANGKESPRDEERDDNDRRQYSYQECVYVINFFNFVVFSIVNSLTMLIFMCLLSF